jgi:uncharacterized protein (DUF2147 family)
MGDRGESEQEMRPLSIISSVALTLIILLVSNANGADGDAILGFWSLTDGKAKFEFYKCGAEYCGKISYMSEPNYPSTEKHGLAGLPKVDVHNPDPLLRTRPLLGLPLIEGFRYIGGNRWEGGRIYNPEDGAKYRCKLWLDGENRLKVRGYIGFSLLGQTVTWVR